MGRFLSPDPSQLDYADPTNPQSLNLYAYVRNNPLINIDPNGLDCYYLDGNGNVSNMNSGDCPTDSNGNPTDNGIWVPDGAKPYFDQDSSDLIDSCIGSTCYNPDGSVIDPTAPDTTPADFYAIAIGTDPSDFEIAPSSMEFIQDVNQDSQHQIGCIAQAYGIAVPGNAGAAAVGAPLASKRFAGWGASQGTSWLSKTLGNAYKGGSFPGKNYASPTGGLFSGGKPFELGTTANFGKAAARWAPYAISVAMTTYASYKLWNCLGGN